MPALSNPKHERFAQNLAKGSDADNAYSEAGYSPSRHNAHRLSTNENVRRRVAELQERAAVRAEISIASVTEALLRLASKGEDLGDASGFAVSRASLMDAAKLNGLVIDRSAVDQTVRAMISDQPLSEAEWAKQHKPL